MSTEFEVTVRATSVTIYPGEEAMDHLETMINLLTYDDEYVEETKTLGFMYDKETDTLYLHKGVDINYIAKVLPNAHFVFDKYDKPKPMKFEYEEVIPPRNTEQEDVINFIAGLHHHSENIDARQIFLVKDPGFGKCEPYSRKIPTPTTEGYTLMGDLQVGDYVFDRTGNPTKVLGIFEQGEQNIYQITFGDGRIAICTENHLWKVVNKDGVESVFELKDMLNNYKRLRERESRTSNKEQYRYNFRIPQCQSVNYRSRYVPIDPWVLGCFIGNGCLRQRDLTISCGTDEIPKKIAEIYNIKYTKNSEHNYSYTFRHNDGRPILTSEFFKELPEMISLYSYEKHIPKSYMINNTNIRLDILQGLMDTDGSISPNKGRFQIMYSTASIELAKDIQFILYSLGFSTRIFIDSRDKYTKGSCYILPFSVPNSFKPNLFRTERKHKIAMEAVKKQQQKRYEYLTIRDIQKLPYIEKCRCILVDNPEHLYLTEDFIVTHNTFCSGVGLCKFGLKTLIIMHRDSLRNQWNKSLFQMSGLSSEYVHEISSSDEIVGIINGDIKYDYDVYLMTHATFRAGIRRISSMKDIRKLTKNLGIGFKIVDEAHLEFRDTLLMDFCFNVKRNLYLTATDGRSSREENSIFKHVFANAVYYRPSALLNSAIPKRWTEYISVCLNTHCKPNIYRYRVAGGRGMNPASYGKWVIQYDKNKSHFKCCCDLLRMIYDKDEYAKVIIFMPLIDLCSDLAYFITKRLNYDDSFRLDLDVRTINSKNSKSENLENRKADVIVTTIASCGTGTDIPGVTAIINCSPFKSAITMQQVFGRIRYCGKICQFYDVFDDSVLMDKIFFKCRRKVAKTLALNVRHLNWSDDEEEKK